MQFSSFNCAHHFVRFMKKDRMREEREKKNAHTTKYLKQWLFYATPNAANYLPISMEVVALSNLLRYLHLGRLFLLFYFFLSLLFWSASQLGAICWLVGTFFFCVRSIFGIVWTLERWINDLPFIIIGLIFDSHIFNTLAERCVCTVHCAWPRCSSSCYSSTNTDGLGL